jgi:hypothetical protein
MPFSPRLLGPVIPAAALAVATLVTPTTARADDPRVWVSPGLSFGVSFGQKTTFALGLDVRQSTLFTGFNTCSSDRRAGAGPYLQVTWLNFSSWRFGAGLHGGGDLHRYISSIEGEVGWTYRTGYRIEQLRDVGEPAVTIVPGTHGLQLGVLGSFILAEELSARVAIPLGSPMRQTVETTITGGVRFPGPFGFNLQTCISGRPLRDGDEHVLPDVLASRRRPLSQGARRVDAHTRAKLARAWLDDARAEGASIPAFFALARDLSATGAPRALVQRALAAARDEQAHTALCSALASGYAGVELRPASMETPPARDASRSQALQRLAAESWQDGCLGEGVAAAFARRSLATSTDGDVASALAIIARDEAAHAKLAWDVAAWCIEEGGRPVRDAIAATRAATNHDASPPREDVDPIAWQAHGRGAPGAWTSARDQTAEEASRAGAAMF